MRQPTIVYNYYFKPLERVISGLDTLDQKVNTSLNKDLIYKFDYNSRLIPLYAYFIPNVMLNGTLYLPRINAKQKLRAARPLFAKDMFYNEKIPLNEYTDFKSYALVYSWLRYTTLENVLWIIQEQELGHSSNSFYSPVLAGVFVSYKTFISVNPKELKFSDLIFALDPIISEFDKLQTKLYHQSKRLKNQIICIEDLNSLVYPRENMVKIGVDAKIVESLTKEQLIIYTSDLIHSITSDYKQSKIYTHPPLSADYMTGGVEATESVVTTTTTSEVDSEEDTEESDRLFDPDDDVQEVANEVTPPNDTIPITIMDETGVMVGHTTAEEFDGSMREAAARLSEELEVHPTPPPTSEEAPF